MFQFAVYGLKFVVVLEFLFEVGFEVVVEVVVEYFLVVVMFDIGM